MTKTVGEMNVRELKELAAQLCNPITGNVAVPRVDADGRVVDENAPYMAKPARAHDLANPAYVESLRSGLAALPSGEIRDAQVAIDARNNEINLHF